MLTIFVAERLDRSRHVKVKSGDQKAFTLAVEALKARVPATARRFDPSAKEWVIADWADHEFDSWLSYCRRALGAVVEESDVWERRTWGQPPPRTSRAEASDHYAVLHLRETAPPEVVRASYKALSLLVHPDRPGGSHEAMVQVNAAYEALARRFAAV